MPTHKARFDPSGRKCPPNSRLPECRVSLEKPFTPHSHRAPLPRPFQPGAQPRQARQPPLPGTVALPGALARGDVPGGPGPTSQTPTAQARGDGSAIGIGAAAGGVAGAAYGARRVAPNVRARAQGYRRVPGRQLTERFRLGADEFGEEGEFSQGRSTTTRQPSRFGMRRRVTRPSARSFGERQLQTERFGTDEFGEEGEFSQERPGLRVSARSFADESRGGYRRIPTRPAPAEGDMDEINLEAEEGEQSTARQMAQRAAQRAQQIARQTANSARTAARSFGRAVAQRLGSQYQRVSTREVAEQASTDEGVEMRQADEVRMAQATETSADDAFEDISRGGVPELQADTAAEQGASTLEEVSAEDAANALGDETLADGAEVLGDSMGVDASADAALDTSLAAGEDVATDAAVDTTATALTDAGVDVAAIGGTEAAVDAGAAGSGALVGAFNPGTDIADLFTFGLASVVGAGIGAGVGAGVGAAISNANKPKPGIKVMTPSQITSALTKLQKDPTTTPV